MSGFETLPAIITRRNSPIGDAIAERIRRRTERALGRIDFSTPRSARPAATASAGGEATAPPSPDDANPVARIAHQQETLSELTARLDFLERLVEEKSTARE